MKRSAKIIYLVLLTILLLYIYGVYEYQKEVRYTKYINMKIETCVQNNIFNDKHLNKTKEDLKEMKNKGVKFFIYNSQNDKLIETDELEDIKLIFSTQAKRGSFAYNILKREDAIKKVYDLDKNEEQRHIRMPKSLEEKILLDNKKDILITECEVFDALK